jgi:NAD(P)-dependent dehydrogenase (short-subunit alcohol dehydrogenase family)
MSHQLRGRLPGKVAFLAGATQGIGRATAEAFALEGARVAIAGRGVDAGEEVAAGIRAAGGEAMFVATDVTDSANVSESIQATVRHYGRLDVLFNNAGGSTPRDGKVIDAPDEEFWRALELDLYGTWSCCKHGIPELIRSGGGSVINMASLAAIAPTVGRDAYTSAKGGVVALTRSMAREFASERVRVNAIAPGAVRTERIERLLETVPGAKAIVARQLLGLIEPHEIAATAVFLAADESRTLTGQVITIHAGCFEA